MYRFPQNARLVEYTAVPKFVADSFVNYYSGERMRTFVVDGEIIEIERDTIPTSDELARRIHAEIENSIGWHDPQSYSVALEALDGHFNLVGVLHNLLLVLIAKDWEWV